VLAISFPTTVHGGQSRGYGSLTYFGEMSPRRKLSMKSSDSRGRACKIVDQSTLAENRITVPTDVEQREGLEGKR
jgi:hypothetical protein